MSDFLFLQYCKDVHRKRWFKKNYLFIETPSYHYSFIKEHYVYEKDNELYKGILHCIWYDKKMKFEAVILDSLNLENVHTIISERDCKSINKLFLLTKMCFRYEALHR